MFTKIAFLIRGLIMIYVIRHGQTDLNKEGRLQGRMGLPLNEYGREQAYWLKTKLEDVKFNFIFSSPQERAIQTAEIVTGISPMVEPRLDVFDLGEADRLKKGEVKMDGVIPDSTVYKGVEEIQNYVYRVFNFMQELEFLNRNKEVNILLSGHRCTTGCIGAYFEGIPEDRNILRFSSENGDFKAYTFKSKW
jgi:probable phosphoglycerate mutase